MADERTRYSDAELEEISQPLDYSDIRFETETYRSGKHHIKKTRWKANPYGKIAGRHEGAQFYTIGQRRGLEVAYGSRIYVVDKEPGGNVRLGPDEALYRRHVAVEQVNFIPFDTLDAPRRAQAKIRYSQQAAPCTLRPRDGGVEVIFDAPQRAVTPGQSAVFYDGPLLLGGGIIRAAW